MPSAALVEWRTHRVGRIEELLAAHAEIAGRGRALRRTQLNWALTMRIAAEFQGYARSLHNLAVDEITDCVARANPALGPALRLIMKANRQLDRGNPHSAALRRDFELLGMDFWRELECRYPKSAPAARAELQFLLEARNAIAHSDEHRLVTVESGGRPLSEIRTVHNWYRRISGLCRMMDVCVAGYIASISGGGATVVAKATSGAIRVGDMVIVDLGMRQEHGEVTEVYGTGVLAEAMVRMPRMATGDEVLYYDEISFPLRLIRHA